MKAKEHYKDGIDHLENSIKSFEECLNQKEFDDHHYDSAKAIMVLKDLWEKIMFGE